MLDKLAIKLIKWRIRKGWGADCGAWDYEDFQNLPKKTRATFKERDTQNINVSGRCGSCAAKQVVMWLDKWEDLINWEFPAPK